MELTFSTEAALLQGEIQKKSSKTGQKYFSFLADIGGDTHSCQVWEESPCFRYLEKAAGNYAQMDTLILSGTVASRSKTKTMDQDGVKKEIKESVCNLKVTGFDSLPHGINSKGDLCFHAGKAMIMSSPIKKLSKAGSSYFSFSIALGNEMRYTCIIFDDNTAYQSCEKLETGDIISLSGKLSKRNKIRRDLNVDGMVTEQIEKYYLLNTTVLCILATKKQLDTIKHKKIEKEEKMREIQMVLSDLSAFEKVS